MRQIIEGSVELGVDVLTLYAFSSDNWKRPSIETGFLMKLFREFLETETIRCVEEGVRINVIGRRDRLSNDLCEAIDRAENETRGESRMLTRIAIDYSSRGSIESAARSRSKSFRSAIEQTISSVEGVPDVDLLIRTGRETRLSDFLLWESAYAELCFVDTLWPDFGRDDLRRALVDFRSRDRRFGGLRPTEAGLFQRKGREESSGRCDVAVVGAGLAGLQCARLLAAGGASVILVDGAPEPGHGVRTSGIFVRKTIEDFDLPPMLLGPVVKSVAIHSPRGRRLEVSSAREEFRVGDMRAIYRHYHRECLDVGVVLKSSTLFRGSTPNWRGSRLTLRDSFGDYGLDARFIVGADGCQSSVARDLGLSTNRQWIMGLEEVYRSDGGSAPKFHCFVDPILAPGYLGWVIDDTREVHVGLAGLPGRFGGRAAFRTFFERVRGLLPVDCSVLERRGGRIPVGGPLPKIVSSRGLLVGDAAGAASPLTAGGLDGAMRLSTLAASAILEALSGNEEAIYLVDGRRFRARFLSRLWMRRLYGLVRSRKTAERALALAASPTLLWLVRSIFFGRGSFPDVRIHDGHLAIGVSKQS